MRRILHPARTTPILGDLALLVLRVGLGIVLIAHGWQKFSEFTIAGTTDSFASMGIPMPAAAAVVVAVVELVGGIALVLGLLTPLFAALNVVSLVVAMLVVHVSNGIFVAEGGIELVLALIVGLVVLVAFGSGRLGVDAALTRRVRTTA